MKKSRSMKKRAKSGKKSAASSRASLVILLGAIAAISIVVISLIGAGSSNSAAASTDRGRSQADQKRYKATRPIVDRQTGQLRMPTKEEVSEMVENLSTLAKRQSEGLQQTTLSGGAVAVDLDGGFGGVILARPTADGGWETKCVFTFEEGVEFLGLVEDKSQQ